jgi:hypothetical protein
MFSPMSPACLGESRNPKYVYFKMFAIQYKL